MSLPKVWNGSAWARAPDNIKVWNGSAWVMTAPKIWDGTGWVTFVGLSANYSVYDSQVYMESTAQATFETNGTITGPDQSNPRWIQTTAVNSANYEIYVTASGFVNISAGLNTWISLSSARTWGVNSNYDTGTITVYIRKVGDQAPSYTRTITMTAQSSYPDPF